MEPERRDDAESESNDAADEFDETETAVTERRDLSHDVKKKLQYKEAVRKFLGQRMPPADDE